MQADLHDPGMIMDRAAAILDLGQPVAVMLLGVLHLIQDSEDPWSIVARLMDAAPASSYLTISHPAIDIHRTQWRPDPADFAPEGVVSAHGAVARKAAA